jgi:hypothetical protein
MFMSSYYKIIPAASIVQQSSSSHELSEDCTISDHWFPAGRAGGAEGRWTHNPTFKFNIFSNLVLEPVQN